ncbi:MAG: LEA type 2 family protein [Proteobacteria bacterium]|nr:LEA type 2 family protein [Pseudomonadota bacterium]
MRNAIALIPVLALAGCPKLGDLGNMVNLDKYTPKLSFDTVKLVDVNWETATADFVFQVSNPNPVEVKVATFSYGLALSEQPFLSGTNDDGMALASEGDTELVLPVSIKFTDAISTAQAVAGSDTIPFALKGDFGFNTPLGVVKVPYDEAGELPVLRLPKIAIAGARVAEFKPLQNKATLEIDLGVTHEQGATLDFSQFDYNVGLNGGSIASGLVDNLASVEAGTTGLVTLPIELNLLEMGATVVQAISKKEKIDLSLGAGLNVKTPLGVIPLSIDETGKVQLQ